MPVYGPPQHTIFPTTHLLQAIQETLVEDEGPPQRIDHIDTFGRDALHALLSSSEFAAAVYSIIAAHAAPLPELREAARAGPRGVSAALRRVAARLALVRELRTRLTLQRSEQDVTLPGRERVFEFVQPEGDVFIAQPPPGLPASQLLSTVLSRELGSPVALPLAPLLEAGAGPGGGGPGALPGLVSLLLPAGHDEVFEAAAAAGVPGAPVVDADARLLALQPLRRYAAGEIVAYRRRSAAQDAAAAAAEARAAAAAGVAGGSGSGSRGQGAAAGGALCYARVMADVVPAPGPAAALATVPLELSPGEYGQLLASQVFCFKSGTEGQDGGAGEAAAAPAAASSSRAAEDGGASTSSGVREVKGEAVELGAAVGAGAASGGGSGAGGVGAAQLAGAVRDMLAAAGMPLDLDKEALLQKALAAERELADARAALTTARREADRGRQRAEELQAAWQCRVCFSAECDAVFIGCGHTFCRGCVGSLARCPVCRKSSNRIRLYK